TCYPGFEEKLEGAVATGARVERDGRIITGRGPGAATEFALALLEALEGGQKAGEVRDGLAI
ncbi:MAG: DJ-1/PfpI family protein, partial [Mesosutterella sp.]|nr:DJ-1/PfpI family protein [Mesosutterella sp.]